MDTKRRDLLATGAAAAVTAAAPNVFAQQAKPTGRFYERGNVRIHYQDVGTGFPLLIIPGGGLNSTIAWVSSGAPFDATAEFRNEFRCITADMRHAYEIGRAHV